MGWCGRWGRCSRVSVSTDPCRKATKDGKTGMIFDYVKQVEILTKNVERTRTVHHLVGLSDFPQWNMGDFCILVRPSLGPSSVPIKFHVYCQRLQITYWQWADSGIQLKGVGWWAVPTETGSKLEFHFRSETETKMKLTPFLSENELFKHEQITKTTCTVVIIIIC